MKEKDKNLGNQTDENQPGKPETDDWYTLALEDMEDFIEEQGIYIHVAPGAGWADADPGLEGG